MGKFAMELKIARDYLKNLKHQNYTLTKIFIRQLDIYYIK